MTATPLLHEWLSGVIPVLPTPFTEEGEIDLSSFDDIISHVAELPVKAVMYPGVASEHLTLTDEERNRLTRRLATSAAGFGLRVIAATSSYSTEVAVLQARWLAENGSVSAVNVLPSLALGTYDDLEQLYSETAASIAPTPVVLQYAPEQMPARMSMDDLASLARAHENIVAVKIESTPCDVAVAELLRANPALLALVGNAGLDLLPALRAGAVAVQPGPGFLEVYVRILDAWISGAEEEAARIWTSLVLYLERWRGRWLGMSKLVARERGLLSTARCRRPTPSLPPDALEDVRRFIDEFDLSTK